MELEVAVLEAIKQKLEDTFKKVNISTVLENREIVIRISIPSEIMLLKEIKNPVFSGTTIVELTNLDEDAQKAANELLGL